MYFSDCYVVTFGRSSVCISFLLINCQDFIVALCTQSMCLVELECDVFSQIHLVSVVF